ncbi:hypothetical protein ACQP1O_16410 [Nocardia sp. CA-151230]|uniref:hypothetical protein n=1 Tax=Nocardia sp. CA-151230 TaxID=3239982 RepID=UPI003D93BADF
MTNTIITDGWARTLFPDTSEVEALVLSGGCVPAAGERDAMAAAGPDARHVDAGGGVARSGPVDTHPHVVYFEIALTRPIMELGDVRVLRTSVGGSAVHNGGVLASPAATETEEARS